MKYKPKETNILKLTKYIELMVIHENKPRTMVNNPKEEAKKQSEEIKKQPSKSKSNGSRKNIPTR